MSISEQRGLLYQTAEAYHTRGWSVIPLRGAADPAQPKAAAVPWSDYRRRHATPAELRAWFVEADFPGLGLICGPISHLAVLDLDDETAYQDFRAACPDLAAQHIIQTQRGYHIYFHLPTNLGLPSAHFTGGDWLWSGRYVVARPTPGYKLIRGGEPRPLDQHDLHRLAAFIRARSGHPPAPNSLTPWGGNLGVGTTATAQLPISPPRHPMEKGPGDEVPPLANAWPRLGHYTLTTQYRYLAPQIGRNEALFRVSCKARDHGWSVDEAIAALADLHVQQPTRRDHPPENPRHRHKEATATIISAFSRPARPLQTRQSRGLPVSVVEGLFALGLTCVVRVINSLCEKGIEAGEPISYTRAWQLLKDSGVGDWSLRKALRARLADGLPVFPPSGHPLAPDGAAGEKPQPDYQNNAYLVGRQNQQKGQYHRPQTIIIMPSAAELAQRLGVTMTRPDPITAPDLVTARGTRLATMRELIARRPGQYPQQWQARRLGVSPRTVQRYQHLIAGLQVLPIFAEIRLHWGNLAVLPDEIDIKGAFLEDETGKKYPPLRPLAAKLLAQGRAVSYKRQDANYYRLDRLPPPNAVQPGPAGEDTNLEQRRGAPVCAPGTNMPYHAPPPIAAPNRFPSLDAMQPGPADKITLAAAAAAVPPPHLPLQTAPPAHPRVYRRPLPDLDHEALAQRVYTTINTLTANAADRLSLVSARRYVDTYGPKLVERALKQLSRRHNLTKPAGFFATVLRSEAKFARG